MTIQGINNLEQTAVKSYEADSKKNAAFKKYKARCKAEGKKPVQRRTWQKKYDSLVKARAEKKARATQAKAKAEAEAKAKAEAKKKEKQIVEEKKTYQILLFIFWSPSPI
jgi:regulator of protease activity HflC (stomatin/prohibitin superfamily)